MVFKTAAGWFVMKFVIATLIKDRIHIPPLGSAYVVGALQNAGFDAGHLMEFVDPSGGGIEKAVAAIAEKKPDVVGFSCFVSNRKVNATAVARLRKLLPGAIVVAGGPDICPEPITPHGVEMTGEVLDFMKSTGRTTVESAGGPDANGVLAGGEGRLFRLERAKSGLHAALEVFDYLIQGEGEKRVVEFARAIENGGLHQRLEGVFDCRRMEAARQREGFEGTEVDLRDLPIPDFGPKPEFGRFRDERNWWPGIPVNFSRGCTGRCSFCNRDLFFGKHRFRPAEDVFREVVCQTGRYSEDKFVIVDDDPVNHRSVAEIEKFAGLLTGHGSPYQWEIYQARIGPALASDRLAALLRKSGLARIQLGVESFSPKVRREMGKPCEPLVLDGIFRALSGAGISICIYLIYGYPTETGDDFQMTLDGVRKYSRFLGSLSANRFGLNSDYERKRPGSVRWLDGFTKDGLRLWESPHVSNRIQWDRHRRLKEALCDFDGFYNIGDPAGEYLVGAPRPAPKT